MSSDNNKQWVTDEEINNGAANCKASSDPDAFKKGLRLAASLAVSRAIKAERERIIEGLRTLPTIAFNRLAYGEPELLSLINGEE